MLKNIIFSIVILALTACKNMSTEYSLASTKYNKDNAGIVVGSIVRSGSFGTALKITNKDNQQISVLYKGAKDFSLYLPEGIYEIKALGSNGVAPNHSPLEFKVNKGVVNYIGQIELGCNFKTKGAYTLQLLQGNENQHWYGAQNCGLLALGECKTVSTDFPVCVFDNQTESINTFLSQNKSLNTIKTVKNLAN